MQLPSTHSNQVGDFPMAYPSTATSFENSQYMSVCRARSEIVVHEL